MSKINLIGGAFVGLLLSWTLFGLINSAYWLPRARSEAVDQYIARQAIADQKAELERKGDDAKLQTLSDYDLCVTGLRGNGMPDSACDVLRDGEK